MTVSRALPVLLVVAACVPERIAGQADVDGGGPLDAAVGDADAADAGDAGAADVVLADAADALPDAPAVPDAPDAPDVPDTASPPDTSPPEDAGPDALPTPSGPCDFVGLAPSPLEGAVTAPVGGFRLELDPHRLRVEHAAEPERTLLATPFTGGLFHAHGGALQVGPPSTGHAVTPGEGLACMAPRFTAAAHAHDRLVAMGSFDDPGECAGATFTLRACQPEPDDLRLELVVTGAGLATTTLRIESDGLERLAGLGMQLPHDGLDLRGRVVPVVARPDGVGRGLEPLSAAVEAASPGASGTPESTPYAAPVLVTSERRALVLEGQAVSVFDLTPKSRVDVRVGAPSVTLHVLRGDSPAELVQGITAITGRPALPPAWVHGGAILGFAGDPAVALAHVDALQAAGALLAGVWTAGWGDSSDWPTAPARAAEWETWRKALAERGVRVLCAASPLLRKLPPDAPEGTRDLRAEAVAAGHAVLNAEGAPYLLPKGGSGVLVDLSKPAAVAWMRAALADELAGAGCAGWTATGGELLPFDAVLDSGEDPAPWHAEYAVAWARVQREALEQAGVTDGLALVAAGHTGAAAEAGVWTAEQLPSWADEDGLPTALRGLLEAGLSGVPLAHTETGGSTSSAPYGEETARTAELLQRWTELSTFTALLRTHPGQAPDANAQVWSDEAAMAHFARMTRVYAALAFYREQLAAQAAATGLPLVRPLLLEFPDDPKAWDVDDELMLGPDLLIAPVLAPCGDGCQRKLYLPPGVWVHLWTGAVHGVNEQGTTITVAAPPGRPPVFYRKASAVGLSFLQNLALLGVEL